MPRGSWPVRTPRPPLACDPGLILFVQAVGDLANFNPHVHVLTADGGFRADGAFVPLSPIPETLLEGGVRRAVLNFLVEVRAISEAL